MINPCIDKRAMKRILGEKLDANEVEMYRNFVEEKEDIFEYDPFVKPIDIFGNERFVTKLSVLD